jgi:hypothetical protein
MLHALPHHRLLALHTVSNVVLDSYAAGGCTTTREALELGKVVVTLPAKFLGGRWSLAYYSIMGVLDFVVQSKQQYVELAVRLGTDASVRAAAEQKNKASCFSKRGAWQHGQRCSVLLHYHRGRCAAPIKGVAGRATRGKSKSVHVEAPALRLVVYLCAAGPVRHWLDYTLKGRRGVWVCVCFNTS